MKALPLSLMTASRSLWCLQTCSRKRHATPVESTVVTVGMAWMRLDSLSTATRMVLYPLDSGSSLMVSTEITSQWQVGIWFGVSFPTFCIRKDLQQCRWDISLVSNAPIGTGFGPQNITVIMSQESHHQHAFLIRIAETIFYMRS